MAEKEDNRQSSRHTESSQPPENTNNLSSLPPDQVVEFLQGIGAFSGFTLTPNNGPLRSPLQATVLEQQDKSLITPVSKEYFSDERANTESEARYVHVGWPGPSTLDADVLPWVRLSQNNRTGTSDSRWASRQLFSTHYEFRISIQHLSPSEAFQQAVSQALAAESVAAQIKGMRNVLNTWGEVIILGAEIGVSLATTRLLSPNGYLPAMPTNLPSSSSQNLIKAIDNALGIGGAFQRRLLTGVQGGNIQAFLRDGYRSWLQDASSQGHRNLSLIAVNQVAPITAILDEGLQNQIRALYDTRTLYSNSRSVGVAIGDSFGDAPGSRDYMKTIRSICVWFDFQQVIDIAITYQDKTTVGPYGRPQNKQSSVFSLSADEYITDIFVWADPIKIAGLWFVKNTGQTSGKFGLGALQSTGKCQEHETEPPVFLHNNAGVLVDLVGHRTDTSITQLQAVWRNDVEIPDRLPIRVSGYVGNRHGSIFNDLELIRNPSTARLSCVTLADRQDALSRFRTTYKWDGQSGSETIESPPRGPEGANRGSIVFRLEEDEYIVRVRGSYNVHTVLQIQFTTNRRTSQMYGSLQPAENLFDYSAPQGFRLYYMIGKSRGWLDGLLFVWAPVLYI